ncbi:hypothetical protein Bca52824_038670 [Brassica carinata]|uniref:Uncharacterized protein n=1 Tax=Brassica carinata TaxID=52824 RepID=A0A8X7RPI6_BRACI|nr:hypothetical protein Bca52824_038670 [Brassica carinata]
MSSAGILLRVWRCVSLRATFIGFVSAALVGLDLAVRGSRVSSAPLRVPLGRTLWRGVLGLWSLAVSSSSWRVRLVATPRSRSGFDGVALFTAGSLSCSGSG